MQSSIIFTPRLSEGMGASSGNGMLFQYQDTLTRLSEEIGARGPPGAGANHNDIKVGGDFLRPEPICSSGLTQEMTTMTDRML